MSKMMSAFKQVGPAYFWCRVALTPLQMEIVLSRYEKDKKALQAENQLVVGFSANSGH